MKIVHKNIKYMPQCHPIVEIDPSYRKLRSPERMVWSNFRPEVPKSTSTLWRCAEIQVSHFKKCSVSGCQRSVWFLLLVFKCGNETACWPD